MLFIFCIGIRYFIIYLIPGSKKHNLFLPVKLNVFFKEHDVIITSMTLLYAVYMFIKFLIKHTIYILKANNYYTT